jgi:hypothetical protein
VTTAVTVRRQDFGFLSGYVRAHEQKLLDDNSIRRLVVAHSLSDVQHACAETIFAADLFEAMSLADAITHVDNAAGRLARSLYSIKGSEAFALSMYRSFFDGFRIILFSPARRSRKKEEWLMPCGFTVRELASDQAISAAGMPGQIVAAISSARSLLKAAYEKGGVKAVEQAEPDAKNAFFEILETACGSKARLLVSLLEAGRTEAARASEMLMQGSGSVEYALSSGHYELDTFVTTIREATSRDEILKALRSYEDTVVERYGMTEPEPTFVMRFGFLLQDNVRVLKQAIYRLLLRSQATPGGEL